jgi:hypothetical protein
MLFLTAIGFHLFNMFKGSILSTYNVRWKIDITTNIQIDFYGAVIPTMLSLFIIFYLVKFREVSLKRYFHYFLISIVLAIVFSKINDTAVVTYYILFDLSISFLILPIAFYKGALSEFLKFHNLHGLEFTRRNYVNALLITFSYAPLSVLIVDLLYAPISVTMYIGAMGLTDGIMLSSLFAPLGITFVTLFVMFVHELHTNMKSSIERVCNKPRL